MREGSGVAGLPAGVIVAEIPAGHLQVSPAGSVLLAVTLGGPGVDTTNDQALIL